VYHRRRDCDPARSSAARADAKWDHVKVGAWKTGGLSGVRADVAPCA
jgi:hypothetical protein